MENKDSREITFFRFEDLRVYHKSLDYHNWILNACRLFPDESANFVTHPFIRSSLNISLYIVEGSARNKTQFVQNLKMAKSAVRECVVHTSIAREQNYFSDLQVEESMNELMELTKMLGALIGSLQKSNNKFKPRDNGRDEEPEHRHEYDVGGLSDTSDITNNNY